MPAKCGSLEADSRESSRPANYAASWMQARSKHVNKAHWVNQQLAFLLIEPLALAALSSTAIETWSRLAPAVQARTKSLLVNSHPSS